MAYSRRHFLSTAPTLVVGSFLLSQQACASAQAVSKLSEGTVTGLTTGQALPLPYEEIPGFLSAAQLKVHHDKHYTGALNGYHALDSALVGGQLSGVEYTTKSRTRTHKANSTFMHELYFSGMALQSTSADEPLTSAMQRRFGSIDRWWTDFQAAALSSRGWASLVYHPLSGKLYNIISDNHGNGLLSTGIPILTLDMFEHAYYLDYQNNKKEYVQRFINYIDGDKVSMRYQLALKS